MERNHQHLKALAGFSILLLEPNQGGRELSTDSTGEKTITLSVTLTSLIYATANMTKLGVGAGEVGFQYNGSNIINVYAYTAKAVGFSWLAIGR